MCSDISNSIIDLMAASQERLERIEKDQKSFHSLAEKVQRQIHEIEDQVGWRCVVCGFVVGGDGCWLVVNAIFGRDFSRLIRISDIIRVFLS